MIETHAYTKTRSTPPPKVHDHDLCVEQALEAAEVLCNKNGSRFTDLRRKVFAMVWQSHRAIKAYDLLDKMATEGRSAKPPTVYRALDFLMEQGLVHKIQSLNAYVGCPHPGRNHVSQFLICDTCETVQEVHSDGMQSELKKVSQSAGFQTSRQTIELHGVCANCAAIAS